MPALVAVPELYEGCHDLFASLQLWTAKGTHISLIVCYSNSPVLSGKQVVMYDHVLDE